VFAAAFYRTGAILVPALSEVTLLFVLFKFDPVLVLPTPACAILPLAALLCLACRADAVVVLGVELFVVDLVFLFCYPRQDPFKRAFI